MWLSESASFTCSSWTLLMLLECPLQAPRPACLWRSLPHLYFMSHVPPTILYPTLSYPMPWYIPSHPIPSHPIPSCLVPSRPILLSISFYFPDHSILSSPILTCLLLFSVLFAPLLSCPILSHPSPLNLAL
jgi:hypothetical protein